MILTIDQLNAICGSAKFEERKLAFLYRLYDEGRRFGMDAPEVVAQIVAQVAHESMAFRHAREIWGPTKTQRGYEGRKDLGNTKAGDGERFMGRDLIQVTGRANYRALTKWLGRHDFEKEPEALQRPEWIGVGVVWYFATRTREGRHILDYCREGNVEMVTRLVNGGRNGISDRLRYYTRTALVMLGYGPDDVREFQQAAGLAADGLAGPQTRAALHAALVAIDRPAPPPQQAPAPVSWWRIILSLFASLWRQK